jgi:hypothetical protein
MEGFFRILNIIDEYSRECVGENGGGGGSPITI